MVALIDDICLNGNVGVRSNSLETEMQHARKVAIVGAIGGLLSGPISLVRPYP